MNKKERELRNKLANLKKKYDEARDNGDSAKELRSVVDEMTETREILQLEIDANAGVPPVPSDPVDPEPNGKRTLGDMSDDEVEKEYVGTFLRAFRKKKLTKRDREVFDRVKELRAVPNATPYLSSEEGEDGGLIVPKDVQTKINEFKRTFFELQSLITVETTTMLSGTRVFERLADATPWTNISQWQTIPEHATPQFDAKEYKLDDYAGIIPVPNTLLQDTDQNLMNYIAKFIARKTAVTRNLQILAKLADMYDTKVPFSNVDDFKDAFNVTLDPDFVAGSTIVTNQDGFNYLDKLKDNDGNYLLQPDVKDPTQKRLNGHLVVPVPNRVLATEDNKAPVYAGDLKEALILLDRGVYEVKGTDVGGDSFLRNSYDIRVIDRFALMDWDPDAVVAGEIDLDGDNGDDSGN